MILSSTVKAVPLARISVAATETALLRNRMETKVSMAEKPLPVSQKSRVNFAYSWKEVSINGRWNMRQARINPTIKSKI